MPAITITIPEISLSVIQDLETLSTQTFASEIEAIKMLREKYAALATHNGVVKLAWIRRGDGSNWSEEKDYFYRDADGKKLHAFLATDGFDTGNYDQNCGSRMGDRLYLLETGEWLRIERAGYWSRYQGATEWWSCGVDVSAENSDERLAGGSIETLTDEQVASRYELSEIVAGLSESLSGLAERIPQRFTKVRQRAELAQKLISALGK